MATCAIAATATNVNPANVLPIRDENHIDNSDRVVSFTEKPRSESWASAGFFVFNRRVLDYLGGPECILEREPLERLAREGQLMAYRHDGFFFAMDTYREYQYLNELWASEQTPWKVWAE